MEFLPPAACMQLLESEKVAHVGVTGPDGPYVTPISFVLVNGQICFRTGGGRRLDAIRAHPRVCVEVTHTSDDGLWRSVIVKGEAHETDDQALGRDIVAALLHKYQAELGSPLSRGQSRPLPEPAVFVAVTPDEMTGRSSGTWFGIPSRPGRL